MKRILFPIFMFCLMASHGVAQPLIHQEVSRSFETPLGVVELVGDYDEKGYGQGTNRVTINNTILLKGKMLDGSGADLQVEDLQGLKTNGKEIYIRIIFREVYPAGGDAGWEKYYIVDLTGKEPVVSLGFDNGDMTYVKKALWSKDKVVITFRDRGKVFLWKDFRLTEVKQQKQ